MYLILLYKDRRLFICTLSFKLSNKNHCEEYRRKDGTRDPKCTTLLKKNRKGGTGGGDRWQLGKSKRGK